MVRLIASNIKQTRQDRRDTPLSLKQKADHLDFSSEEVNLNIQSDSASKLKGIVIRTSRRQ
jgi:hypothetical protein